MRVVPVSIADKGLVVERVTAFPLMVRPDTKVENNRLLHLVQTEQCLLVKDNSQKEGVDTRGLYSMLPLKNVVFVPPRVKTPP